MKSIFQNNQQHNGQIRTLLHQGMPRAVGFTLLWWILTGGNQLSWVVGLPVVAGATGASLVLLPSIRWSWSLIGVLRFLPFFLWQSWIGSMDVVRRALHPCLPLVPSLWNYQLRLPPGSARVFMVNLVSLLPGTLSAELQNNCLTVHGLDENLPVREGLQVLEARVADLFNLQLPENNSSERKLDE